MSEDRTRERRDWRSWHDAYVDPDSPLSKRLVIVQHFISEALDRSPPGSIRVISACAGQGHDLLGVLPTHARGPDVVARLIEFDPDNAEAARRAAAERSLAGVEVVTGDASDSSAYADWVPTDIVLMCGVFGNIPDDDVLRTVDFLPSLCRPGATVIWTRSRHEPDLTVQIRRWLSERQFDEVGFGTPPDSELGVGEHSWFGVGAHVFRGEPAAFVPNIRLFTFFR